MAGSAGVLCVCVPAVSVRPGVRILCITRRELWDDPPGGRAIPSQRRLLITPLGQGGASWEAHLDFIKLAFPEICNKLATTRACSIRTRGRTDLALTRVTCMDQRQDGAGSLLGHLHARPSIPPDRHEHAPGPPEPKRRALPHSRGAGGQQPPHLIPGLTPRFPLNRHQWLERRGPHLPLC